MCIINTTINSVFTTLFLINFLWLRGGQEAIPYANTEVTLNHFRQAQPTCTEGVNLYL